MRGDAGTVGGRTGATAPSATAGTGTGPCDGRMEPRPTPSAHMTPPAIMARLPTTASSCSDKTIPRPKPVRADRCSMPLRGMKVKSMLEGREPPEG